MITQVFFDAIAHKMAKDVIEVLQSEPSLSETPYFLAIMKMGTMFKMCESENIVELATWMGEGVYDDFLEMALPDENISSLIEESAKRDFLAHLASRIIMRIYANINKEYERKRLAESDEG